MHEDKLAWLGNLIKCKRKEEHLTQEQLSMLSGVSVRHVANIEKGRMNPSFEVLCQLNAILKIPFDNVFSPTLAEDEAAVKELTMIYTNSSVFAKKLIIKVIRSLVECIDGDGVNAE